MAQALIAAWLLQALLGTLCVATYLRQLRRPQPWPAAWPPVLVLVPVRGAGPTLDAFLTALAAQDHPDWRVVFAIEDPADPATATLARFVAARPGDAALVVAGRATRRGQKVHNLLAAFAQHRAADAAIVTLDADTRPAPDLLRVLLRPLATGQAPIATGYRWTLPADAHPASAAVARADLAIATLPPLRWLAPCWGGATAIRRDALAALDLPRLWDRALADDLSLTRAARRRRLRVYAPLTARLPSPAAFGWAGALGFGVRQYRLLRLLAPWLWRFAAMLALLPVVGCIAAGALLLDGDPAALGAIAVAVALATIRAALRRRIAAIVFAADAAAVQTRATTWGAGPIAALLRLAAILGSASGRRITWAGRCYRLDGDGQVTAS